jgi:hypothetical protein
MTTSEKIIISKVPIVLLWDQHEEDDDHDNPFEVTDEPQDIESGIKKPPKRRFSAMLKDEIESIRNRRFFQPINDTKKKVIGEIAEDINQIDRIKQYRLKYVCATFCCFLTTIIGGFALLFGLAVTDLFNNRKRNIIIIAISGIFFIPLLFWIRFYFFPSPTEQEKNRQSQLEIKRQAKMRKKQRFLDKGLGDEYRLEDEYVATENELVPRTEYLPTSKTRGNFYDSVYMKQTFDGEKYRQVVNYSGDNGYMNDYYFQNVLYKDVLSEPMKVPTSPSGINISRSQLLVDDEPANIRIWGGNPIEVESVHKKRKEIIMPALRANTNTANFNVLESFDSNSKSKKSPTSDKKYASAVLDKPISSPKVVKSSSPQNKRKTARRTAKTAATSPTAATASSNHG